MSSSFNWYYDVNSQLGTVRHSSVSSRYVLNKNRAFKLIHFSGLLLPSVSDQGIFVRPGECGTASPIVFASDPSQKLTRIPCWHEYRGPRI